MQLKERVKVAGEPRLWRRSAASGLCPGCTHPLIGRIVSEVIEEMGIQDRAIGVSGVTCLTGEVSRILIDAAVCVAHGRAVDVATGIKRSLHNEPLVFTMQGDGDCTAIGIGSLVSAAFRAEQITVIMANNTNYGLTGGQVAPTTLTGQITTTTPDGRGSCAGYPAHIPEMLRSIKGVAYAARGALVTPAQHKRTKEYIRTAFEKQMAGLGLTFVEVLSACPTDWHLTPIESMKRIEREMIPEFPLGEVA